MLDDPRIERALDRTIERGEVGVQVAVYQDGELVLDASIGQVAVDGPPVGPETLFPVFSVSKAFLATAVHLQAERGLLDVDATIASYWPEYAAKGKAGIRVIDVLQHRAGVPQAPPWLTPERFGDWEGITAWLADAEPLSPPGVKSVYHSLTFGWLLGEVLRRSDPAHRPFDQFLRQEICGPLGIEDVWFGLPAALEPRVAELTWGANLPAAPEVASSPLRDAMMPPAVVPSPDIWNRREMHAACNPAVSGIMTARDGARFLALLACQGELSGIRLLSRERLLSLTEPRPNPTEIDEGIGMATTNGVGGYWVGGSHPLGNPILGPGPHVLGHGGAGGSAGWADLDTHVAVMINHNRMFGALPNDRHPFIQLADAIREVTNG